MTRIGRMPHYRSRDNMKTDMEMKDTKTYLVSSLHREAARQNRPQSKPPYSRGPSRCALTAIILNPDEKMLNSALELQTEAREATKSAPDVSLRRMITIQKQPCRLTAKLGHRCPVKAFLVMIDVGCTLNRGKRW